MKRRRGRRGFWWWSWLLALVTIGGVVGGYFYGNKRWEDGPKNYQSWAKVSIHIRPPFVARGAQRDDSSSRLDNLNEEAVLRDIRSEESLTKVISELNLTQAWELGTDDALTELRNSVNVEYERLEKSLTIVVTRHDPNEAAEVANTIANGVAERVKVVDEKQKLEGEKTLAQELDPFIRDEEQAKTALKDAFADKGVTIDPKPGMNISTYLLDPNILEAHIEWETTLENLKGVKAAQGDFESHWKRGMRPTIVTEKAFPAPSFVGPEKKPIQVEWALYGLTLGMVVGSLLSLLCWKLFP